jgi:penicillin-binding protein A
MIQSSPVTSGAQYPRPQGRRLRFVQHGLPLIVAALAAFGVGAAVGGAHRPAAQKAAERFAEAWERGDLASMHALLTEDARAATPLDEFRATYARAAATSTLMGLRAGRAETSGDDEVRVELVARTRVFGTIREPLVLPVAEEDGEIRIAWDRHLTFPGVPEGERLERRTRLPSRARLLAADGTVLASGPARTSDDPELAASIAGQLGEIPPERAAELRGEGVPRDAQVGLGGLERALDDELRGRPGGILRAGDRVLAATVASPGDPVRSTIVPRVQRAAVEAIGGRVGGVVAMHPRTGEILAAAGIGLSGLQPPGSTFKIITLTGALEARITSPAKSYPVETFATLEGVKLENANGESCGGSLMASFAESCNSVFGPLGAQLGAKRLVETAEAFGFNRPPGIDGAATSVIPAADQIGDDLAVGASAIGQGKVQASALQLAIVASTIANRGERPVPTLLDGRRSRRVRVVRRRTASLVGRAMRRVVREGTGVGAAIPGVGVAGKTGTAELRTTQVADPPPGAPAAVTPSPEDTPEDTTAWFAAYAPSGRPRVAVAVMLVGAGAGGESAAPAAKLVLSEALRRGKT